MKCNYCGTELSSRSALNRHIRSNCPHRDDTIPRKKFKANIVKSSSDAHTSSENNLTYLTDRKKVNKTVVGHMGNGMEKLHCAFKSRIASFRFKNMGNHIDYRNFLSELEQPVSTLIIEHLQKHHALKVHVELFGLYTIPEKDLRDIKSFNTKNQVITLSSVLSKVYKDFGDEMLSKAADFQEKDSGWALEKVLFLDVNINKFCPLSASSYIKLPRQIESKRAILNIKNTDNACFAWAINAAIFPARNNLAQVSSYPHYTTLLNFENIEFPVKLRDIPRFETLNNISVNVFGLDSVVKDKKTIIEVVGPLYFTSARKATHVNLLLISDDEGNNHYCLIKNLSRLVSSQISNHHSALYICDGCLQFFRKEQELQTHAKNDCNHLATRIPTRNIIRNKYGEDVAENILTFINFEKQLMLPFVIYADFECILKPISYAEPYAAKSFTVKTFEHEPYSFGLYVKCNFDDNFSEYFSYRDHDAAEVFSTKLDGIVRHLYNKHLKHVKEMLPLTTEEEISFNNSSFCHICDKPFLAGDIKVRDHDHCTGLYRSALHGVCNLNYKIARYICVYFHNLNFDKSLFLTKLALQGESVSVIAQTKEKYISFSKQVLVEKSNTPNVPNTYIRLRFVDTLRFLPRSLDALSQTLEPDQCVEIRRHFPDDKKFNLLRQKGVFPYQYVSSRDKLNDTELPSKEEFFDVLRGEPITQNDYERALEVWRTFNCTTLGQYSDIYLKSDVLLLADIFENFRKVCMDTYKLDPAHYLTAPSLSWDAMLRYTQVKLELLTDINMIHYFRQGIRGGVSQCTKRKSLANNAFLDNYDSSKPTSYILFLDATSLYGFAMEQFLPTHGFRWLEEEEIENLDCTLLEDNSPKGYILEVDLDYPAHLHDAHNELPFCPENITPPDSKWSKLIPNLFNKQKYIIHYRNLKQCLKYGLQLKKVHRVLEFSQSPWLKPYIALNTRLRNSAKNDFERELYKLLINSIFGKTMENVDKRRDIKLSTHWQNRKGSIGAKGLIAKPFFKSCTVFAENLVAIEMQKVKVCYDKPVYIGFSILDISKTVIYEFFYSYIKAKYGDKATLCYMDTDSLILEILTTNVYEDMKENIELFDTSNYVIPNVHNMPQTISVVGKMKDEFAGKPIECFYGTGAKAYCIKAANVVKKAKGISKNAIKHHLHLSDYIQTVETGETIFRKMYIFKSDHLQMYTELKNKVALSSHDDKRFVMSGGVNTLAWGHVGIPSQKFEVASSDRNLDFLLDVGSAILASENNALEFDIDLLD